MSEVHQNVSTGEEKLSTVSVDKYVDKRRKRVQIGDLRARKGDRSERECMEMEMSPAQKEVFLAIDEWWKRFGYSPTVREIAYVTGRSGVSGVHKIVNRLVKLGVVKKMEGAGRTIRPVYINFRNLE
jgi:hypothetical protein